MGSQCGDLILIILDRHFGPNVKIVARKLLYGPKPLKLIFLDIDLKLVQVKEALHILIRHDLVLFSASKNGLTAEYKLNYKNILKILSYSKYLQLIETKYDTVAKDIVYDFMINGYSDLSHLIVRLGKQSITAESVNLSPIKDTVNKLVLAGYVIRHCDITSLNEENLVPKLVVEDKEKSLLPTIDMKVGISQLFFMYLLKKM
ncbi:hypothetical protein WDU94_003096 [Cyamophila willieti]